jgi:PHD/YefM family antitoxin component YafN of YafNO toxin-antitoxin module
MLWSPGVVELNRTISDITSQIHQLTLLNQQGLVYPDTYITMSNQLAEQLRKAKQHREKLLEQEDHNIIGKTRMIMEVLSDGPEYLEVFDEELFCELIDKIVVESNTRIRFRLKNGLELPETTERTVR